MPKHAAVQSTKKCKTCVDSNEVNMFTWPHACQGYAISRNTGITTAKCTPMMQKQVVVAQL